MPDSSQQVPVIAVAAVPFSHQAARDADEGQPVMVTGAVPEQVAAYELIAEQIGQRLGRTRGR
jgi:thiamine monophosphate kinase